MAIIVIICLILSLALFSTILTLQPITAQEQIRLEALSDGGTFKVEILWIPNDIGNVNKFEIHFFDPDTGSEIEDIKYDISIYKDDRPQIQRLDQVSISQEFFFEDAGSYEISIDDIEDLGERDHNTNTGYARVSASDACAFCGHGTGPSRACGQLQ